MLQTSHLRATRLLATTINGAYRSNNPRSAGSKPVINHPQINELLRALLANTDLERPVATELGLALNFEPGSDRHPLTHVEFPSLPSAYLQHLKVPSSAHILFMCDHDIGMRALELNTPERWQRAQMFHVTRDGLIPLSFDPEVMARISSR